MSWRVILSAVVLGAIMTSLPLAEYYSHSTFWSYFQNTLGIIHFDLPGVFASNPVSWVNASLWTVPFELECYAILAVLALLGLKRLSSPTAVILLFAGVSASVAAVNIHYGIPGSPPGAIHGRVLVLCFLAGVSLFIIREHVVLRGSVAAVCFVASMFLAAHNKTVYLCPLLVAYATVYVGLLNPSRSKIVSSGDYSYGLYLYAAPIQQTVSAIAGPSISWLLNVAISLPTTLAVAWLSWHFIERRMQKFKNLSLLQVKPRGLISAR